ncbi:MAG TPA: signal peptidase I [Candidatus Baltobacteraceae bacterium]|jgi:signal peptidase I|nr:signal peptidase I [Candidatus Baltobacteraceae bacterium]
MTPLELLGLVCLFAIVRVAISLRPASVPQPGEQLSSPEGFDPTIIREYLDAFIFAGLVALFIITFVVRTFFIPSGSMLQTLQIHDVLLANEFEYRFHPPHDGDIIVFKPPIPSTNDFIKRTIAGPGETLRIEGGVVYRDGLALTEPYIAEKPIYSLVIKNYSVYVDGTPLDPEMANIPPRSAWSAPDRIPAGCYFMMGDNRNNSEDSHIWGFAQSSGTFYSGPLQGQPAGFTGHAFIVFWPIWRLRLLD